MDDIDGRCALLGLVACAESTLPDQPGSSLAFGDECDPTNDMCGTGLRCDSYAWHCVDANDLSGEDACEGHGYTEEQCAYVGCCHFEGGYYWSSVGDGPCAGAGGCSDNLSPEDCSGECIWDWHSSTCGFDGSFPTQPETIVARHRLTFLGI